MQTNSCSVVMVVHLFDHSAGRMAAVIATITEEHAAMSLAHGASWNGQPSTCSHNGSKASPTSDAFAASLRFEVSGISNTVPATMFVKSTCGLRFFSCSSAL